jgi:hypothetical protein
MATQHAARYYTLRGANSGELDRCADARVDTILSEYLDGMKDARGRYDSYLNLHWKHQHAGASGLQWRHQQRGSEQPDHIAPPDSMHGHRRLNHRLREQLD